MTTDPVPTEEPVDPPRPPCTIHLLNGTAFVVEGIDHWTYTDTGAVFAHGHYVGEESLLNLMIPEARIDFFELDFAALTPYLADHA